MQLLAIKIGNTNIGYGLFDEGRLTCSWRVETRRGSTDEYASELQDFLAGAECKIHLGGAAIGSVVPALTVTFQELCLRHLGLDPFIAGPGVRSGIEIRYEDPRALGADRLADMVAARARYDIPAIVVDFGTATTFNGLDRAGNFVGGAIAPGLQIQAEAIHQFTARLPLVEVSPPPRALATNTRDALRSGIFLGYAGLVEGMISRLRSEMAEPAVRVIATGGLARLIAPYCPSIEMVDPALPLEGLRILYELNRTSP